MKKDVCVIQEYFTDRLAFDDQKNDNYVSLSIFYTTFYGRHIMDKWDICRPSTVNLLWK